MVYKNLATTNYYIGVPARMISDRGTAFTYHRFKTFCQENGIKHILNAVATPRANGQCERVNRTVISLLANTCAGEPEEQWDQHLKKVQSAINCTVNRTTRRSPAELLLRYKPRSTADAALLEAIQSTLDGIDLGRLREEAKGAVRQADVQGATIRSRRLQLQQDKAENYHQRSRDLSR